MAKKKKKSGRSDARGYSTSNTSAAVKQTDKTVSSRKVAVSAAAHEGLTNLLTDLKGKDSASLPSSKVTSSNKQRSTYVTDRPGHTACEYPIDPSDKKFIKKVSGIHDTLIDLSFTEEQIKSALLALGAANGSDFDLELSLDWLCLNLSSEELPSLFIEQDVQIRALEEGGISVHVVKGGERRRNVATSQVDVGSDNNERESANELVDMVSAASLSATKYDDTTTNNCVDDEEHKAKRALLLAQYQYEDESDAEHNTHDQIAEDSATEDKEYQVEEVTTPEEKKLAELERQISEDTATLNDDGALYMMSKYEIGDLKKRIKKLQGQAKGLRGKVTKIRAAREKKRQEENGALDGEEEEVSAALNIFGGGGDDTEDGGHSDIFTSTSTSDADVQPKEPPPLRYLGRKYSTVSTTAPSIPKDWTGTTPKQVLEDYCSKQKLPRPKFSKLPQTSNGCKIIVCKQPLVQKTKKKKRSKAIASPEEEALVIENLGPFFGFSDSQQYLATEALYELSPLLPLYRLLPPIFREIWTTWQKEEKEEQVAEVAEEEIKKRANIEELVMSIYNAYKESSVDRSNGPVAAGQSLMGEKETGSEAAVLDAWDDQSSEEEGGIGDADIENSTASSHYKAQPSSIGKKLCKEFERKTSSSAYKTMLKERKSLPIYAYRQSILDTVRDNTVTVLCASTGAGKSTNCPLFLLEEALETGRGDRVNIICTQPRRVAAISVAERVSDEMSEDIGGTVGYHIRMEAAKSSKTKLMFCTTGVILRR